MAMVTVLAGALAGALITVIIQSFLAVRNMDISALNDNISLINSVESLAVDYWLRVGEEDPEKELASAARLRGTLDASAAFEATARRLFKAAYESFQVLDGDLFDAATGGQFESAGRKADPERAIAVMQLCNRLRGKLREQRRNIFIAH